MPFISPYKNRTVLPKTFLLPLQNRIKGFRHMLMDRPWNGTVFYGGLPTDARLWVGGTSFFYFAFRPVAELKAVEDEIHKPIINRYGGTLESARAQLSDADYARLRFAAKMEATEAMLAPQGAFVKPEGLDLPGQAQLPGRPAH
eukprot:240352_1